MQDPNTRLGHNRTGLQVSPLHDEMLEVEEFEQSAVSPETPDTLLLAELRREYVNEADALGSIPPPGTMKGVVKSGVGLATGSRMHVLVDRIAERLAYERGGTRLYDAALVKVMALSEGTPVNVGRVREIRNQEAEHAALLTEALTTLGADPTAQTPCADLVGVQAMGLMQAITDPRTSLVQTLSTLLAAELIDVASWELLGTLARATGNDALAERFHEALLHENQHLDTISGWVQELSLAEAKLTS